MKRPTVTSAILRRSILRAGALAGYGMAGSFSMGGQTALADDDAEEPDRMLIERLTGRKATTSGRVRLDMPPVFANGFSVPLTVAVDSPMTESDYVTSILVLAPRNPIVTVVNFRFTAQSGRAAVSTRIRLSEPQSVLAVSEMSDGSLLMASRRVKVEIDGCS